MLPLEYAQAVSRWCGAPQWMILDTVLKLVENGRISLDHGRIPVKVQNFKSMISSSEQPSDSMDGWQLFRHLVNYYIECVRAERSSSFTVWSDDFGRMFSYLNRSGQWYPRQDTPWTIYLDAQSPEYFDNLAVPGQTLCLGYPVFAQTITNKAGEQNVSIKPIFCWRVKCKGASCANGYMIQLEDQDQLPEVNLEWLRYGLKNPAEKRDFLEQTGLFDDSALIKEYPDEEVDMTLGLNRWSVKEFARIISQRFRPRLLESINPDLLVSAPIKAGERPGYYNRAILFISQRSPYSKRLLSELELISCVKDEDLDKTALKHFFWQGESQAPVAPSMSEALDVLDFNVSQRGAVAAMLKYPVSILKGPPGTGKSQVVAGVAINERIDRKSVLISATNHKAIDAVVERLEKMQKEQDEPYFVRCSFKDPSLGTFRFDQAVDRLLKAETIDSIQSRLQYRKLLKELALLRKNRAQAEAEANKLHELQSKLGHAQMEMANESEENPWIVQLDSLPSEEQLHQHETLIDFIRNNSGSVSSRLAHPLRLWSLRKWGDRLGTVTEKIRIPWLGTISSSGLSELRDKTTACLNHVKLNARILDLKSDLRRLSENKSSTDWSADIANATDAIAKILPDIISLDSKLRVEDALGDRSQNRAALSNLRVQLLDFFSEMDARKTAFFQGSVRPIFEHLLTANPVWAVSALSVGKFIPPVPGLFDLVLIDEATQTNIAQAIPLLFRAKRAAVIGDPQQLQFISQLRPDRDYVLRVNAGLKADQYKRFSYCEQSLYDFAAGTNGAFASSLNETYRSCEAIAAYSSQNFYGGSLLVATDPDRLRIPPGHQAGIEWVDCASDIIAAPGSGCWSEKEALVVAQQVKSILINAGFQGTVGVVTPFAHQALYIDTIVRERLGIDPGVLDKANFLSRTAHSFQGDERDVIIMSLCSGPSMPGGCLHFVSEDRNIFNVAASRARSLLIVVGDRNWAASCSVPHIQALTRDWRHYYEARQTKWAPYESPYEQRLGERLKSEGMDVKPQFKVSSRRLDLALIQGTAKLDIEVDSERWHLADNGNRQIEDTWRDEQLIRLGWKPLRIWTFEIDNDLDKCVALVKKQWQDLLSNEGK